MRARIIGCLITLAALVAVALMYSTGAADPTPRIAAGADIAAPPQPGTVVVTYIANEGVLIANGDKGVLIDGLHRRYQRGYPYLPAPHSESLETASAPFDRIDLILVSHLHLDHFHPESVGRHLQYNPRTRLVSSEQVVGALEKGFRDFSIVKSRITTVTPPLTQRIAVNIAGIEIQILGVGHGSGRHALVQNLGHLITLGGKKFLHLGDADADPAIFEKLNLDDENIDVAFLPAWFFTGQQAADVIRAHIKPRHIVAVHMPADGGERAAAEIKARFPGAVALTTLLERRTY